MRLNKKTIGAAIFAALILLLFFSKTIYSYNMPSVTAAKPTRGALSKLEISTGIAGWEETESIYVVRAGIVGSIFVKEGDAVEKGQLLLEMNYDVPAVERRLAETENNINKLEADIYELHSRADNIRDALEASNSGLEEAERLLTGQAGFIALEISKARTQIQNAEFMFELGIQSRNDLINAENSLQALFFKYEAEADDIAHNLILKEKDLENLKLSREATREILMDYRRNEYVKSPNDGIILDIAAEKGKLFQDNAFLISIGVGSEFVVECVVSLDNNFINPGDICELSNASHTLQGKVRRVRPSAQGKTVTITVSSDEVNDGETFLVTFEETSLASFILVPNSAINQDSSGYFVYQIKRRRGIMGEEYILERLNIFISDSDYQNTIIVRGITFFEPIVIASDKLLSDGQTVSVKNPEDFFEN